MAERDVRTSGQPPEKREEEPLRGDWKGSTQGVASLWGREPEFRNVQARSLSMTKGLKPPFLEMGVWLSCRDFAYYGWRLKFESSKTNLQTFCC